MNVTEMVCIVCPNGCHLKVSRDGDTIDVQGAKCKRGIAFGTTELTNPTRSLTTTVDTAFPDMPRLPVKTNGGNTEGAPARRHENHTRLQIR